MRRAAAIAGLVLVLGAPGAQAQDWHRPWRMAQAQERHGRPWQSLTPEEQWRAWENYQRYQQLPEQRQRMLQKRWEQFRAMPPQERQRLCQSWQMNGKTPALLATNSTVFASPRFTTSATL